MPKILNTTARPYNMGIAFKDGNGVLRNKPFHLIPGEEKEVSKEDLKQLKSQKGFKRFVDRGFLKVLKGDKPADESNDETSDEPTVSKTAKELAEANDIDLSSITPNNNNTITVAMVEAAVAAKKGDDSNDDL